MNFIERGISHRITEATGYFPVTAILGPRQCGKTTLSKLFLNTQPDSLYIDLELPSDLARLREPEDFLSRHAGKMICLDEIQRVPELFPVIRSLVDKTDRPGQFLILGSASPALLKQSSETLAGRIAYIELTPFTESEIGKEHQSKLWLRGGFPKSFLAPTDALSRQWLDNFIQTFLERDIPQLGIRIPAMTLRNFWRMCAHYHGDLWNHSKIAGSLGVTGKSVAHYLSILSDAYMLRVIPPYSANVKKRLVKSPKVYLRDTGLLHRLLDINNRDALDGHPVKGRSWESYVIEQIAATLPDAKLFFYRTAAGAEMDLVVSYAGKIFAVEMKASSAPRLERGFRNALDDLKPDYAWVAASVDESFTISKGVEVAAPDYICKSISEGA